MTAEITRHQELEAFGIRSIEVGEGKDFLIAAANTESDIRFKRQMMRQLNGQFPLKEIVAGRRTILIEQKGLEVYSAPIPSRSKASQALYLFQSTYTSPAVQGYVLEDAGSTSFHEHKDHWERIVLVDGHARIRQNEKLRVLKDDVKLDTHVLHMLEGGLGGAVIVCITYGPGDCFDMDDHYYHPKPVFTPHP